MAAISARASRRIAPFVGRPTVWHEFAALTKRTGSVNLGQGFPSWPPPKFIADALADAAAASSPHHSYSRSAGSPELVRALGESYTRRIFGGPAAAPAAGPAGVDADTEVVVTNGATEALYLSFQAFVDPGDEVILLTPAFDIYSASVAVAGGTVVSVPYGADGDRWTIDFAALERAFTPRTKMIVLNTPHNPTGKVWTRDELGRLAGIVARNPQAVVVSDEVYEHIVFGGARHELFASLPGMWERTVTISSAGKFASVTGWKVGWAVGPRELVEPIAAMKCWTSFSTCSVAQHAVAVALDRCAEPFEGHDSYLAWLRAEYTRKRRILVDGLTACGLNPMPPDGSFFVMARTGGVEVPAEYRGDGVPRDLAFCRFLAERVGVVAIPTSAFHDAADAGRADSVARFAFCKTDEELVEASRRLLELRSFARK